jgi:peptidoglycan/LPS O-acetylase OafA/YrhL
MIDGVRGLCALGLVFTHVAMVAGLIGTREVPSGHAEGTNAAGAFFASGLQVLAGVFFVLSGLFLYLPFARAVIAGTRRPDATSSFVRRALRLLPAYYAMYLVVLLAFNSQSIDSVWYVLRPILLMQVYDDVLMHGMEVTWTVPAMAQWYLALPLIAWATHRFATRGATPVARAYRLMLPVPLLFALGFGWLLYVKLGELGTRMLFWWPMGLATFVGVGIALGVMLALSQASPKDTPKLFRLAAAHPNLFLLGAVAALFVNSARPFSEIGMDDVYTLNGLVVTYLLFGLFGLLLVTPLVAPGTHSRLAEVALANKPVAYLGRISYGVYLWHFAVMHFYLQGDSAFGGGTLMIFQLRGAAGFGELFLVTVLGAVAVASVSYYLLERPLLRWGERYTQRRRLRTAEAPAQPGRASLPS